MVETRSVSPAADGTTARPIGVGAALLLVLAVVAAYANSLRAPFTFDDFRSIAENATLHSPAQWFSPPQDAGVGGRPLLNASFGLNYALGKLEPAGYHVFNLAVHAACALLVCGVVRRVLGRAPLAARVGPHGGRAAWVVALLWALHPLHTESITYISQRAEALAGFFLLATLYAFLRSLDAERPGPWRALSVAACILGMMVKEILIFAPLVVLACDRLFGARTWRQCWRERSRYYLALASSWVLLAWLITRNDIESRGVGFSHGVAPGMNLLVAAGALARYFRLTLWPEGLVLDYGRFEEMGPWIAPLPVAGFALLALGTILAAGRGRARLAVFAFGAWVLLLLPTTGLVPTPSQPLAEHRMYLPLLPLVAGAVMAAFGWLGQRAFAPLVALALLGGSLTLARNRDYGSEERSWRVSMVRLPENPRIRGWLAGVLVKAGRTDEAMTVVRDGLKFRPSNAVLHRDHGRLLRLKGENEQAILAATMAVAYDGNDLESRTTLYQLHGALGNFDRALPHLRAAWDLSQGNVMLANDLAHVLLRLGQREEALRFAREAVRLAPNDAGSHGNLAMVLLATDRLAEAGAAHAVWQRLQPAGAPPNHEFARALVEKKAWAEARAEIAEMLRRHPGDALTLELRGVVERESAHETVKPR